MIKEIKLGNISELKTGPFGTQLHANEYVSDGIPVINVRNIGYGEILSDDIDMVSEETLSRLSEHRLCENDIVFGRKGSIDRHAFIDKRYNGWMQGSDCIRVRIHEINVNPRYVSHYLKLDSVKKQLTNGAVGSTMPSMNTDILKDILVLLPDIEDQDNVEQILTCIETKIENNNAICADLEAMAKLLYDYWFVQFDFPDENGKPYKSSGGKMVWNEELKREIPEGWEVKPLGELITVIRGISYKPADERKEPGTETIALLKSNNIQNGSVNFDQPVYLPKSLADTDQWLTKGSVFITMSSGSKAHMGKTAVIYRDLPYVFGAFCAKIDIVEKAKCFVSTYFRSDWFRAYIEKVTAGTSINNIGNNQLTDILIPMPYDDLLERFEVALRSSFDMLGELIEENRLLCSLRDFLLPMLMNGQVKVSVAE